MAKVTGIGAEVGRKRRVADVLGLVLVVLLLPLLVLIGLTYLTLATTLYLAVWSTWLPRGRRVILVYSNSPAWQTYIETNIIPRLPANTVILNWSERSQWRSLALPVLVWRFFAGRRDFNPVAIVFRYFRFAKVIRFYRAFRDSMHGRPSALAAAESELFRALGG